MKPKARWLQKTYDHQQTHSLAKFFNINELTAVVLMNRGINTKEKVESFFNSNLQYLSDPLELPNMSTALKRIKRAIKQKEGIVIYGDYDVDGVTATSILLLVLRQLGAKVDYYLPNRIEEGYGLNAIAIKNLAQNNELMITVDCGVSAIDEIALANSLNLDVIVTDHHLPQETLPAALAVINPKCATSDKPYYNLAGVGVALKLAHALLINAKGKEEALNSLEKYLDLAALGTIADIVPLLDENRTIVKVGLQKINRNPSLGVAALLSVCRLRQKTISTGQVSFGLAPRLNAGGRVGSADAVVRLLTTNNEDEAMELATFLDAENDKRRQIEAEMERQALNMLEGTDVRNAKSIILAHEGWHHGIVGIVASRLVERFFKPTILLSHHDGQLRGSARSIPAVHMFDALTEHKHLLQSFGGHSQAAGLSMAIDRLPQFKKSFDSHIANMTQPDDFVPVIKIDANLSLADANLDLIAELEQLQPFGMGNPKPVFAVSKAKITQYKTISAGKHLKLGLAQDGAFRSFISWQEGHRVNEFSQGAGFKGAFHCELNEWQGKRSVTLIGKDWSLSSKTIVDQRGHPNKIQYIKNLIKQKQSVIVATYSYSLLNAIKYQGVVDNILAQPIYLLFTNSGVKVVDAIGEYAVEEIIVYDMPYHTKQIKDLSTKEDVTLHLLYNKDDASRLCSVIKEAALNRATIVNFYNWAISNKQEAKSVLSWETVHQQMSSIPQELIRPLAITILNILQELNIWSFTIGSNKIEIQWLKPKGKTRLEESRFYQFYQNLENRVQKEANKLLATPATELIN